MRCFKAVADATTSNLSNPQVKESVAQQGNSSALEHVTDKGQSAYTTANNHMDSVANQINSARQEPSPTFNSFSTPGNDNNSPTNKRS